MQNPERRMFRFSLRTLLLLVTAVCCWLGWESSVVRARQALLKEIRASPFYSVTTAADWARRFPAAAPGKPPRTVSLVRRWLGDEAIQDIGYYSHYHHIPDAELKRVARTFPEASLHEEQLPLEPCHPGCFPRGTLVETPAGPRAIETIRQGDVLRTVQPGGESGTAAVQSIFVTTNELRRVETEAGLLWTTPQQPLALAEGGALAAGDLEAGRAILYCENGSVRPVQVLSVSRTRRVETVYNLVLGNSELFVAGGYAARSKPPADR